MSIGGTTTQAAVEPLDLARCFQHQSPHANATNWIAPRSAHDSLPFPTKSPHLHEFRAFGVGWHAHHLRRWRHSPRNLMQFIPPLLPIEQAGLTRLLIWIGHNQREEGAFWVMILITSRSFKSTRVIETPRHIVSSMEARYHS